MRPYPFIKRFFDMIFGVAGLVLLLPLFAALSLYIKLDSAGPVIFKQKRIGRGRKHFKIYKYRTMRTDTPSDKATHLLEDPGAYITRSGRFLRKTSLDELPQLLNIIKGDMSVIGPRPALWNQHDLADERDKYGANDVRPGLTGWAQINGRDELPIPQKAALDGLYISKMSLLFDMKIFFGTLLRVVSSAGNRERGR